jgi:hypothetical protein
LPAGCDEYRGYIHMSAGMWRRLWDRSGAGSTACGACKGDIPVARHKLHSSLQHVSLQELGVTTC